MVPILITLLSPFLQLGTSYYASVASVVLLLCLFAWRRALGSGFSVSLPLMIVVAFMPLSLIGLATPDPLSDQLRVGREALLLIVLLCALAGFRLARRAPAAPPEWMLLGLVTAYLVIVWFQTAAYNDGTYLGFPPEWYAQEQNTFATEAALFYGAGILRPHATFSEPSYLGFMLLSIALMLVPRLDRSRPAAAAMLIALLAGLLSRSLSFFLAMLLVILLPILLERGRNRLMIVVGMLALSIPAIALSGNALLSRLSTATSFDTADESTAVRIFGPLYALPGYLARYPAGNPISIADRNLVPFLDVRTIDVTDILNNAFFNLLFSYGIVGFAIVAAIMIAARDLRVRLYLATGMMFNGAFLAIDKVAIILFALAVYEYNMRRAAVPALPAPRRAPAAPRAAG